MQMYFSDKDRKMKDSEIIKTFMEEYANLAEEYANLANQVHKNIKELSKITQCVSDLESENSKLRKLLNSYSITGDVEGVSNEN